MLFKLQFLSQTDRGTMAVKVCHMKNSLGEKQMLKCYVYLDLGAGLDDQQNIYQVATSSTNEEYYAKCSDTNNTATHIVYLMLNPAKYLLRCKMHKVM
jgi:hypothetical protein